MYSKSLVPSVCVVVKSFTLAEACDILEKVNPAHLTRMMTMPGDDECNDTDFHFIDIGNPSNLTAALTDFWYVWYIAGPPDARKWVKGSLCQYVADALLTEILLQGEEAVSNLVSQVLNVGAP